MQRESTESRLEQRIARLERLVEELRERSDAAPQPDSASSPAAATTGRPELGPAEFPEVAAEHTGVGWRGRVWDGEFWLNKLGIGLVLFGVTFLFHYSIEQGWLTPEVRVGFGALVGTLLLAAGSRIGPENRGLARVLLGGGIGVFYIVGFAAFQLYGLLGYHTAFAFMAGVTVLAFALAVREDHPVLALVGVKGALGTPFLLYRGDGDVVWLVSFASLVMASSVALFVHRGWRSLVWTAALGGWAVHLIGFLQSFAPAERGTDPERLVVQSSILFGWVLFALVVPAREYRLRTGGDGTGSLVPLRHHLHLLAAFSPLAALALSAVLWSMSASTWGWIAVAIGSGYAAAWAVLRARDRDLAEAQLFAASALLVTGAVGATSGETLYVTLAVLMLLAHLAGGRTASGWQAAIGHGLAISLAMWFTVRMDVAGLTGTLRAVADPLVLTAALVAAQVMAGRSASRIYTGAVHLALLAWFWRELVYLPGGAALVSSAWGMYAILLLALGARLRWPTMQKVAISTILALVAKLFLIDLAALEAIWRILLFLGLGTVLLLSSYALQGVWRTAGSGWPER